MFYLSSKLEDHIEGSQKQMSGYVIQPNRSREVDRYKNKNFVRLYK